LHYYNVRILSSQNNFEFYSGKSTVINALSLSSNYLLGFHIFKNIHHGYGNILKYNKKLGGASTDVEAVPPEGAPQLERLPRPVAENRWPPRNEPPRFTVRDHAQLENKRTFRNFIM
jgi:hypothetical protein